ncbi:LuxR family transcriptional regulator [Streptomyces mashuensis]|uniref:LuxR family transcriptional regulator n=1 Tax=Streptomyces mashuensis TaxID=33904 RepID=A0A919B493_9ACTN|nr:AAA family ATPase [Streptomyces mashuensis]GHF52523.1 LuxR family transcriptional regulator [Streptomyces mashuensis]
MERDSHLAALNDLLQSAKTGRGRVVLVSGAVASGKTQLLESFTEQAMNEGVLLLDATASRAERDLPFGVLRKIFDHPSITDRLRTEVLHRMDDVAEEGPHARMQAMPYASWALMQLAAERTVVIAVDDVHCADDHSLQFLLYLARRVRQVRVLIVLTQTTRLRQEQLAFHAELLRQPHCSRVQVDMLTARGTADVLAGHLSPQAAARISTECHRITGGNPLLLRALLEDSRSSRDHGEPFQRPAPAELFSQAVRDCLHRGEPETLLVAQGVAVLGGAGSTALLSRVLDVHAEVAEQGLKDLDRCAVLTDGAFRDDSARDAVLAATPKAVLQALHLRAAQLLHKDGAPALEVARHLLAAQRDPDTVMVPVLQEAAEYALVDDDVEFALRCLELAHAACPDEEDRAVIKARLVSVVWRLSPAAAEGHLPQLTAGLRPGRLPARDVALSLSYLAWSGHLENAADTVRGLTGTPAGPAAPERSALEAGRRWLTMISPALRAVFPGSGADQAAAPPAAGLTGDAHGQAASAVAAALAGDHGEGAVAEAQRVLQRYRLSDNTLQPLAFALLALLYTGRADLAQAWCERLLGECQGRRTPAWHALLSAVRAEIALRQGDLPGAAHHANAAMSLMSRQSWGVGIALPLATLVQAETAMGRHEEATALLEQPVPEALFRTLPGLHYLRARGRCHLATGRYHAALEDFLTCGRLMGEWGVDAPELVPWRVDAAEAWLALGDPDQARALAERQPRRGDAGARRSRGAQLLVLARTVELKRRLHVLKEAVEILEQGDDRLQLAIGLGELGNGYRALGEFNRARLLVRKAWHVAKACGAEPLCQQLMPGDADGEVATAQVDATGEAEALTEAESRVALLAAHGHTNREIATKLYVTVSTVEQHLTRIYRKLKVKRRRDLPSKLAESSMAAGIA